MGGVQFAQTARRGSSRFLWLGLVALSAACAAPDSGDTADAAVASPSVAVPAAVVEKEAPSKAWLEDDGFVVWESRRSGKWRIWTRRLDGSGLRQLTPDEPQKHHCCPHISPDGEWVTYLSLPSPKGRYSKDSGPLRLVQVDGSEVRELVSKARTYFENRVVVWRSSDELIFIDDDGRTRLLDVNTGESSILIGEPSEVHGFLVNSSLTHATTGRPTFSPFKAKSKSVGERDLLGGCQPYFSQDGRWGFWTAGAGGPIDRLDLATGRRDSVLRRNDDQLPEGRGYVYFPMLSDDGGLLAVGASKGDHSHFTADYDVFVLPTDPRTFEVTGPGIRFTEHPGSDRYPDVWRAPKPLGRHWGEAPLTVTMAPEEGGSWEWSFGDGAKASGPVGEHTFERPGSFQVEARQGDTILDGLVTVEVAAPPILEGVRLRDGGRRVELQFDEPVSIGSASAKLASDGEAARLEPGSDARIVVAVLSREIESRDRLLLDGLADQAQRPNRTEQLQVPLELPGWPAATEELVFLWETAASPNAVFDPATGSDRTFALERTGAALLDRDYAMVVDRGTFEATEGTGAEVSAALKGANEFSVEVTVTPRRSRARAPLPIVSLGVGKGTNLQLTQQGERLILDVRIGRAVVREPLMTISPGELSHVVVTYQPGSLAAYKDGVVVHATDEIQKDFYHWDPRKLSFGEPFDGRSWAGTIQGVAIYTRALEATEVAENHDRFRRALAKRSVVESFAVEGKLIRSSAVPSLQDISPYREALSVNEYEVVSAPGDGFPDATIHVAQWSILDGRVLQAPQPGDVMSMRVERLAENPQLESVFLSDTIGSANRQIFYAVDPRMGTKSN